MFEALPTLAAEAAGAEKPCGCHDKTGGSPGDLFSSSGAESASAGLIAELDAALAGALSGAEGAGGPDLLAIEEQLELAANGGESQITLEDILAFAERYPGLKITFSF
jgi:hypothetical protein